MIQTQSADGVLHQFPDGTDPAVIDRAMKSYAQSNGMPKAKAAPSVIDDAVSGFVQPFAKLHDDVVADYRRKGAELKAGPPKSLGDALSSSWQDFTAPVRMAGDVLGLTSAPAQAVVRPVARMINDLPVRPYEAPHPTIQNGHVSMTAARPLYGDEAQSAIEGGINTALSAARPGGAMTYGPARPAGIGLPEPSPAQIKAARYVERVANSAGATPDSLTTAGASGKPLTSAEAIGKPGQVALGALARRQGQTGDDLAALVGERQLSRGPRLQSDFADAVGISPEAAAGDIESVVAKGQAAAKPLYEQALGSPDPIWNDTLESLAKRPAIEQAIRAARTSALNGGRDPSAFDTIITRITTPREVQPGRVIPSPPITTEAEQAIAHPTAETWDWVKKAVDGLVERDPITQKVITTGEVGLKNRDFNTASSDLRRALAGDPANNVPGAIPGYREALDAAGDYLGAHRAFQDGGKFLFDNKLNERKFAEGLSSYSPPELEAFKGGIANKIFDLSQSNRLDPKVLRTPRVQAKLEMALGKDAAEKLISAASEEGRMLGFERRYAPAANSITAEMADAMAQQDAEGVGQQMAGDVVGNLHHGPKGAMTRAIGNQVQRMVATARTPGLSVEARDAAGKLLMSSPQDMANFLRSSHAPPRPNLAGRARGAIGFGEVAAPLARIPSRRESETKPRMVR